MREVLWWVWYGAWWTPLIGAIYLGILLSLIFGGVIGMTRRHH